MAGDAHDVFINGVRYVPASTVRPANARAIKLALLEKFWGDCSCDSDEELNQKWENVFILVTDEAHDPARVWAIDDLLDRISQLTLQEAQEGQPNP